MKTMATGSLIIDFCEDFEDLQKNLLDILECVDKLKTEMALKILHVETRKAKHSVTEFESCFILLSANREENFQRLVNTVDSLPCVRNIKLFMEGTVDNARAIPRCLEDLDKAQHLLTKFDPHLRTDHPGFNDQAYRRRRQEIANLALNYKHGQPLPDVIYNEDEIKTWRTVYNRLKNKHMQFACIEYIKGFKLLEEHCGFCPAYIPQLKTVSDYLQKTTGFRLRPVAGLVSPRDFLANFAFRVFPCTQYIRHHSRPEHTPEPDLIHEFLGHMPMLTDPNFVEFVQQIGLASLGCSDDMVNKLATIFWFTIEFGLCQEQGQSKALGAGILSSYGELENAFDETSEKRPFEPEETAIQTYDDVGYQPVYFICDSIDRMKEQMTRYIESIPRETYPLHDPYTNTLVLLTREEMRSYTLERIVKSLNTLKSFEH